MNIDTAEFAAVCSQLSDQAEQIDRLSQQFNAMTEALRASYAFARRPLPEGLCPRPRDRHGMRLVQPPPGGAA
jgi:hypothetical protein